MNPVFLLVLLGSCGTPQASYKALERHGMAIQVKTQHVNLREPLHEAMTYFNSACKHEIFVEANYFSRTTQPVVIVTWVQGLGKGVFARVNALNATTHLIRLSPELRGTPRRLQGVLRHEISHLLLGPNHVPRSPLRDVFVRANVKYEIDPGTEHLYCVD